MPAADHGEAGRAVEIGAVRQFADGLLARIDQVGIDLVGVRERPDAKHAVLALQRDMHALRNVVGDQRRDADAEIDVIAVAQFLRGAGRHLVAVPACCFLGHQALSLSRVVSNSIFLS